MGRGAPADGGGGDHRSSGATSPKSSAASSSDAVTAASAASAVTDDAGGGFVADAGRGNIGGNTVGTEISRLPADICAVAGRGGGGGIRHSHTMHEGRTRRVVGRSGFVLPPSIETHREGAAGVTSDSAAATTSDTFVVTATPSAGGSATVSAAPSATMILAAAAAPRAAVSSSTAQMSTVEAVLHAAPPPLDGTASTSAVPPARVQDATELLIAAVDPSSAALLPRDTPPSPPPASTIVLPLSTPPDGRSIDDEASYITAAGSTATVNASDSNGDDNTGGASRSATVGDFAYGGEGELEEGGEQAADDSDMEGGEEGDATDNDATYGVAAPLLPSTTTSATTATILTATSVVPPTTRPPPQVIPSAHNRNTRPYQEGGSNDYGPPRHSRTTTMTAAAAAATTLTRNEGGRDGSNPYSAHAPYPPTLNSTRSVAVASWLPTERVPLLRADVADLRAHTSRELLALRGEWGYKAAICVCGGLNATGA